MQIQEAYFIKRRSSYQINGIHYLTYTSKKLTSCCTFKIESEINSCCRTFFPRALKSINQTEGVK